MVAGREVTPKDVAATERLRAYWKVGNGSQVIRWGAPGDFARCVAAVGLHMKNPEGYCAKMHHEVLGIWPPTHAAATRGGRAG